MARILLSKQENDFLREQLICVMRHYTREIDADRTLLESCTDGMEDGYEQMLKNDIASLELAKGIYENLLSNR